MASFSAESIVLLKIEAEHKKILEFMDFLLNNKILAVHRTSASGLTWYHGSFYPEEAEKIKAWLKKNNIKQQD